MGTRELIVQQVIVLSWFRCLMEEGYDFLHKKTGAVEKDELVVYRNFQKNTGAFDLPSAKCSPKGLEKNLLEVIGNLVINNKNPVVTEILISDAFKSDIHAHIRKVRNRDFSGKAI